MNFKNLELMGIAPYGYITIRNSKTNEILFEGHNMITHEGKEFIVYKLLKNIQNNFKINTNADSKFNYDGFELSCIEFGYNPDETSFSDSYKNNDTNDVILRRSIDKNNCTLDYANNGHFFLTFTMNDINVSEKLSSIAENANSNIINNIRICLSKTESTENGEETTYKLFSKANLDPIPFNEEVVFSLTYNVYF